ncbi:serine/threonine protein kinase [Telluria aromaticivorans]|uniref:Stress response kinase A n=1 Tax=Telluria aromaticivorans TaxID=2725995 RepID=A0A7Y2JZ48_9BURK|nr:serine/threonine protein kinase [Telluria aromaticivorans]NNG23701.1 serine/threonine protein kinase [Telluria aromaticivorans]
MDNPTSPDNTPAHPYARLDPQAVLEAVESVGLYCDGRLLALNSYENRVYQVGLEEGPPVVVKFYRPGRWSDEAILEEHAFVSELAEREIPVVPADVIDGRTLHSFGGYRFSVFPRRGGRAPELGDPATLEWIGRFIGRIHAVGALHPFTARPELNQQTFGREPFDWLRTHGFIPPELAATYASVVEQALIGVARCYERAGELPLLRLHGDCHAGNVLWTPDGPHFVDFDDSRMGPAIQDLWMLLSGERQEMVGQMADVLAGYEDFCEFHPRQLYLVEALRTLRLIHYSYWLAMRWIDPAFPAAFPWFNTQRYWQDRILELREQVALMDEPPLWQV